jgi:hypothetical protein
MTTKQVWSMDELLRIGRPHNIPAYGEMKAYPTICLPSVCWRTDLPDGIAASVPVNIWELSVNLEQTSSEHWVNTPLKAKITEQPEENSDWRELCERSHVPNPEA